MSTIYFSHEDEDQDGINDYVAVYSKDYSEPLFGDYRGVELCRVRYIPSREESVARAEEIARSVIAAEQNAHLTPLTVRQNVVCPECEALFAVEVSKNAAQVA